jgi:hypothetical protein
MIIILLIIVVVIIVIIINNIIILIIITFYLAPFQAVILAFYLKLCLAFCLAWVRKKEELHLYENLETLTWQVGKKSTPGTSWSFLGVGNLHVFLALVITW